MNASNTDDDSYDSICDKCGSECVSTEKNKVSTGPRAGVEICNDCYAELPPEQKPEMN